MKFFKTISIVCSFALIPHGALANVGIMARLQNNKKSIAVLTGCAIGGMLLNHRRKLNNARRSLTQTKNRCRHQFINALDSIESHFTFEYDLPKNDFFERDKKLKMLKDLLLNDIQQNKADQLHLFNQELGGPHQSLVDRPTLAEFLAKKYSDVTITKGCLEILNILNGMAKHPDAIKSKLFFEKIIAEEEQRLRQFLAATDKVTHLEFIFW